MFRDHLHSHRIHLARIIFCVLAFGLTLAIALSQDNWRRTERGWERMMVAHSERALTPLHSELAAPQASAWIQLHRCIVPVAIACFLATSGAWFLQTFPTNRGEAAE